MTDQNDQTTDLSRDDGRKRLILEKAIEQQWQCLLSGIRVYVWKFGLAKDRNSIDALAREILNDTVVTALEKSGNYSPDRPAHAWLLRVAFNHVRHRVRARSKKHGTVPVADTAIARKKTGQSDSLAPSEEDMLDLLYQSSSQPFRPGRLTLNEMLSLVSETDREVLQLAFIKNLRGKALAAELGISEGAAYTRTSRAIANLRKAFKQDEQLNEKGN